MASVIIYTATWCKKCHELKPLYDEVMAENPKAKFKFVDVDENDEDCPPTVPYVSITRESGEVIVLSGYNEINGSLEMSFC